MSRIKQRRKRKALQHQQKIDSQIIALAPIPARQANYRRATNNFEKCTLCRFNPHGNFCELFDFNFTKGFVCDRFESRIEITKSLTSYRQAITSAARGLHSGNLDIFDFIAAMNSAIDRGYEQAWREGARTCGILSNERTPEETSKLNELIAIAKASVFDFAEFIEARLDEPFTSLRNRIDIWANRYNETRSTGSVMACQDQKLEWFLGNADHCKTCIKLNGRVMRASRWQELDVHPQDTRPGKLECKGFNCDCELSKTTKPATPGPLPSLP
jgi:hypothetical protein